LFEDLFHQKLKRKIENNFDVTFGINIIRYERFNTCLNKIIVYNKSNPIDFLIFHIRPEPFLRLVKFYYKYLNYNGKRKYSLNIPLLKLLAPEKYDILILGRQFYSAPKPNNSKFHKFLVDLNYKAGNFLGNTKFALEKYFELVADIANYYQNSNIKLLLLGPALRTNTSYEPILCKILNDFIIEKSKNNNIEFIDGLGSYAENFDTFLDNTGIHVTGQYHEMIAERLYNRLSKEIERLVADKIEYIQ